MFLRFFLMIWLTHVNNHEDSCIESQGCDKKLFVTVVSGFSVGFGVTTEDYGMMIPFSEHFEFDV